MSHGRQPATPIIGRFYSIMIGTLLSFDTENDSAPVFHAMNHDAQPTDEGTAKALVKNPDGAIWCNRKMGRSCIGSW